MEREVSEVEVVDVQEVVEAVVIPEVWIKRSLRSQNLKISKTQIEFSQETQCITQVMVKEEPLT